MKFDDTTDGQKKKNSPKSEISASRGADNVGRTRRCPPGMTSAASQARVERVAMRRDLLNKGSLQSVIY